MASPSCAPPPPPPRIGREGVLDREEGRRRSDILASAVPLMASPSCAPPPPPQPIWREGTLDRGEDREGHRAKQVERGRHQDERKRRPRDRQEWAHLKEKQAQKGEGRKHKIPVKTRVKVVGSSRAAASPTPVFPTTSIPSMAQEGEVLSSVRMQKVLGSQRLRSPIVSMSVKSPGIRIILTPRIKALSPSPSPSPSVMRATRVYMCNQVNVSRVYVQRASLDVQRRRAGCHGSRRLKAGARGQPRLPALIFAAHADAGRTAANRPACIPTCRNAK